MRKSPVSFDRSVNKRRRITCCAHSEIATERTKLVVAPVARWPGMWANKWIGHKRVPEGPMPLRLPHCRRSPFVAPAAAEQNFRLCRRGYFGRNSTWTNSCNRVKVRPFGVSFRLMPIIGRRLLCQRKAEHLGRLNASHLKHEHARGFYARSPRVIALSRIPPLALLFNSDLEQLP